MGERRSAVIIVATILVVVGLVLAWVFATSAKEAALPAPIEVTDTGSIQQYIQLSRVGIATSENYFGHKVRLISATLKNVSDKPVRMVEVKMVFTDFDGKPIHESIQKAFESSQKPLPPGSEYRFETGFENLPRQWNYRVPITEVTKIGY